MIDALPIRGGDGAATCPPAPVDPPRPRIILPGLFQWENTGTYATRDRSGRRGRRVYLVKHVWATRRQWARLDVNHEDWHVVPFGPFVVAWRIEF